MDILEGFIGGTIMSKDLERNTHKIETSDGLGEVHIADEVVAIIVALAATEVEGVASMAGNMTHEIVAKLGMKSLSKGVSVEIVDNTVSVKLALNLEYGYSVPEVCAKVQDKVKTAIENMTALQVLDINVTIADVNM